MQGVRLLGIGTQIFLQNLAGGTFIRVGTLIRHCIVASMILLTCKDPHDVHSKVLTYLPLSSTFSLLFLLLLLQMTFSYFQLLSFSVFGLPPPFYALLRVSIYYVDSTHTVSKQMVSDVH